ncbi:hypothetical protein, partial [Marinospirillum sp.]|uniref:hypothetical protein n=1 Tax=Marinospirillum sp. TaxID=2183934 RepID=UPI0025BE64FA
MLERTQKQNKADTSTFLQFIQQLKDSTVPGFQTTPTEGADSANCIHDAYNREVAWVTPLSFVAYQLNGWLESWRTGHKKISQLERLFLKAWNDGVQSAGWPEKTLSRWHALLMPGQSPIQTDAKRLWNEQQRGAIRSFN